MQVTIIEEASETLFHAELAHPPAVGDAIVFHRDAVIERMRKQGVPEEGLKGVQDLPEYDDTYYEVFAREWYVDKLDEELSLFVYVERKER